MSKLKIYLTVILCLGVNSIFAQRIISLEESKNLALKNNVKTKNSFLEIESSRQLKKSAFTNYFPSISATGMMFEAKDGLMEQSTKGGNLPVYDGDPANLQNATQYAYFPEMVTSMFKKGTIGTVMIVQPVFAGGRIFFGNKLASLGEEVSEYKYKLSENEVLLKTEEQYWLMVSLEEKMKTIIMYESLLNSLINQVEDAYKSGIIMKNDVLKVKLKRSEVLLNKSKLENGKKLALMAFCQYVGIPFDSTIVFRDDLTILEEPQNYYIQHSEALKKRTEYNLLQKSVEAEDLQTHMKLGEYLPQIGVGLSGIYMKFDENKERTTGMVFGSIQIPISGWWGGFHELEERSVKEKIAENNFNDNSELLLLQMEKAWQDLNDAYKQYKLSEESRVQAEENLKINEDSYKNGLINVSDLLEAQALSQQTKDQLIDSKTNYKIKISNYLIVTGRVSKSKP